MNKAYGHHRLPHPLFAEERQEQIVGLLQDKPQLLVQDICKRFNVSPATARSDLRALEKAGRLRRTHGGAIPAHKAGFEPTSDKKQVEQLPEKERMALHAATLVEEGDTIALDSGTTTFQLAKVLCGVKQLIVVTNDIPIATYMDQNSDNAIYLMGGLLRKNFGCTIGPMTLASLSSLNVDKAFMATNAFSLEKGFTTPNAEFAECKKAMLAMASQHIMMMDSQKVGRVSFSNFASLKDFEKIVSDTSLSDKVARAIRDGMHGGLLELV